MSLNQKVPIKRLNQVYENGFDLVKKRVNKACENSVTLEALVTVF